MGLLDFFKKKTRQSEVNEPKKINEKVQPTWPVKKHGNVNTSKIELNPSVLDQLKGKFIAFDVETTGLSVNADRIVELGAVIFIDGKPTEYFSTLVNPLIHISPSASAVNHITNDMIASAPGEPETYSKFLDFIGDAINGETLMCAHNASFDFSFLSNTLSRLGFDAEIHYIDTLSLSRKYVHGLENYQQCTLENHFGFSNGTAHRAKSDAENCGKILKEILLIADKSFVAEREMIERSKPCQEELFVCAFIQHAITERHGDIYWLRFRKNSSGYVDAACLYTFLKFKFAKKGKYVIVRRNAGNLVNLSSEPCTASEGGTDYIRVFFKNALDLTTLSEYIFSVFNDCYKSMMDYIGNGNYARREAENAISTMTRLSDNDVLQLLEESNRNDSKEDVPVNIQIEPIIDRSAVIIEANHTRVPLAQIKNRGNWDRGFDDGYPYWEQGETARKDGHIDEAILLFDKARYNGYEAPALYESYAKAYRTIKDYSNEIVILEEGMERLPNQTGIFEARRDKALKLLYTKQESERIAKEKERSKAEKAAQKEKQTLRHKGRCILQMDDDGNIIKEFETIAAAANEVGVSSKSIRDAANGVQKHAGGFCWTYKEQCVN